MRIAIVTSKFLPIIGGGETYAYLLAKHLVERGHRVEVLTGSFKGMKFPPEKKFPFQVNYIDGFEDFCVGTGGLAYPCECLYLLLTKGSYDIIHVHNYLPMFLVSQFRSLLISKIVFTFHNTPFTLERICGYFRSFELDKSFTEQIIMSEKYDLMVLGSNYFYEWALKLGARRRVTKLIYLGVDQEDFNPLLKRRKQIFRQELGFPKEAFVITLPSRIIRRKGILEMLSALKLIIEEDDSIYLFVPAFFEPFDKEFAKTVVRVINKLGINNRILSPKKYIGYKDMPGVYSASDLVVMPSYYEGLGLALIEAMSIGIPVIGSDVTGINEVIIDDINGLLVPSQDHESLASAIKRIRADKTLRERLVMSAFSTVKSKFDININVKNMEECYKKLLKG